MAAQGLAGELGAVDFAAQDHVGEQQRDVRVAIQLLERIVGAARLEHPVAEPLDEAHRHFPHRFVVLDDQNLLVAAANLLDVRR